MSRIGNKPVVIPQGVKVQVVDRGVSAEGPKGKLVQPLPPGLSAKVEDSRVIISRAGGRRACTGGGRGTGISVSAAIS